MMPIQKNSRKSRPHTIRLQWILLGTLLLATGCSSWKLWNPSGIPKTKWVDKEKTTSLFDSKPNTKQAQIDFAIASAERHEAKQELREAMKKYQEALELDKKNSLAHHRIALIACRLSANKQAQEHFESAYKLAPKENVLAADYGYWLYLNGQDQQAEQVINQGLQRSPDFERFHGISGLLHARARQFEPAVNSFIQSGCTPQQAWANIGHVLLMEGDVQSASYWIEHAAQGDEGSVAAKKTQDVLQASYTSAK
jgi:Tfp pilus assembly protein PilF